MQADGHTPLTDSAGNVYESVVGTKESAPCSNRGICDPTSGICSCFNSNGDAYDTSNGYGGPGQRGDCGWVRSSSTGVVSSCPSTIQVLPHFDSMLDDIPVLRPRHMQRNCSHRGHARELHLRLRGGLDGRGLQSAHLSPGALLVRLPLSKQRGPRDLLSLLGHGNLRPVEWTVCLRRELLRSGLRVHELSWRPRLHLQRPWPVRVPPCSLSF